MHIVIAKLVSMWVVVIGEVVMEMVLASNIKVESVVLG